MSQVFHRRDAEDAEKTFENRFLCELSASAVKGSEAEPC
jgi:hypothetical protein